MATSYTTNAGLQKPAFDDLDWHTPILATINALDAMPAIGPLSVRSAETPSASLNIRVAAGGFTLPSGADGTYAGTASFAIAASSTEKVWLTAAGVLTKGAAWPSTPHVRLASVTTSGSAVTGIVDERRVFGVQGGNTSFSLVQTYATADATLNATFPTSAFTGATDGEAKLTDLQTVRLALLDLAAAFNALVDELQSRGVIG